MAIQTKVCKLCKEEKAVGLAFSKNENSDDGFSQEIIDKLIKSYDKGH